MWAALHHSRGHHAPWRRRLLADLVFMRQETVGQAQFILRQPLHSDKETTLCALTSRPLFDETVNCLPAAQIEVADAKIGPFRYEHSLLQGR
jgi:hypothetical protein